MAIVRCEKGMHLFNNQIHAECPNCGSPASTLVAQVPAQSMAQQEPSRDTEVNVSQFGFENADITIEPSLAFQKPTKEGITQEISDWLSSRYRFLMPLSSGGMGRIFLVQEVFSGRFVALKVLLERAVKDQGLVQQFVREAVITARLQHPNIIPVYDLGFASERKLFYTMRYIDGIKFSDIIEKTNVDIIEKIRVLRNVAQAVHFAHQLGLWHRDLKPENILIGALGDTYVIDWGLVSVQPGRNYRLNLPQIVVDKETLFIPDQLLENTREAVTTAANAIMGTPAYMSPEQVLGHQDAGKLSDIWALGVMLYQSINNAHPIHNYRKISKFELLHRVMYGKFPPLNVTDKKLIPLVGLCTEMIAKEPQRRLSDLSIFIKETAKIFGNIGPTITIKTPSETQAAERHQIAALKEKNAILAELVSLSPFAFRRRRVLMNKLLRFSNGEGPTPTFSTLSH